jgi:hypothetical protein
MVLRSLTADDLSPLATVLFGVLAVVLTPASVLVQELGHALVARVYRVPIEEVVVMPQGRTITVRRAGRAIRVGLGLKRTLRSTEPAGWVELKRSPATRRAAAQILLAGPLAEGMFGLALVFTGVALPVPVPLPLAFVMAGALSVISAAHSLLSDGDGRSDGARLRRLRRQ